MVYSKGNEGDWIVRATYNNSNLFRNWPSLPYVNYVAMLHRLNSPQRWFRLYENEIFAHYPKVGDTTFASRVTIFGGTDAIARGRKIAFLL